MSAPLVACPTCRRPTRYVPENRFRPFCSQRCREIDLGAWASEQFRVAAEAQDEDAPEGPAAPVPPPPSAGRH